MYLEIILILQIASISLVNAQINWQDGQPQGTRWALACDFIGNDLSNQKTSGQDCASTCTSTSGCTHFTWTTFNDGTCWMKTQSVSESDAFSTGDKSMVCGIVPSIHIYLNSIIIFYTGYI